VLGLKDRGLLREGYWADIVVFDPDTVADMATYENPKQYPKGIDYVLVNGKVVIEKGQHTGARPGRVVYGPGKRGASA
jgi:N-acyl-D-aspartate/D-glutamate deacylase